MTDPALPWVFGTVGMPQPRSMNCVILGWIPRGLPRRQPPPNRSAEPVVQPDAVRPVSVDGQVAGAGNARELAGPARRHDGEVTGRAVRAGCRRRVREVERALPAVD